MNDSGMIINPSREKGEPQLPATGLFLINPAEAQDGFSLARENGARFHFLFNSGLAVLPETAETGTCFLAGPSVGAPMAVMSLEKCIALGARRVIVYGWCGSLNEKLPAGSVLLPTWAVSDEGTSRHYPVDMHPESHAPTRQLLYDGLTSSLGLTILDGPVWTTDAPYRESTVKVKELATEGVLGVDMEFAALIAVAAYRKIDLAAVLLVSDELWTGTWNPCFRSKSFKKTSRDILRYLVDFCSA